MAISYLKRTDLLDINNTVQAEEWIARDDVTGYEIAGEFPSGTSSATASSTLGPLFPASPTFTAGQLTSISVRAYNNRIVFLDANGKAIFSFRRTSDGGVDFVGYDTQRNALPYNRNQILSVLFKGTKTMVATFPTPFVRIPSVSLTLANASNTPPYKVITTLTTVTVRFGSAYTGAVDIHAVER